MPQKEKGKSHSNRPVSKRPPNWCKYQPEEVEVIVNKLSKEGHRPSVIGTIMRDQYAIPLVKLITGKKITEILRKEKIAKPIPEDLENLLKKAAKLVVHLEKNRKDVHNLRARQIVEAKIHKLSKYYKRKGILLSNWKYKAQTATLGY